ncbi:uncharacterized protein [Gossypium hirsutum]|uniref:Tf2-1-like SH3-like domain-containing protein n=1 Tax=Gossypium hirsutum TaxID=3635 RepID=A0A1U8JKI1_GOSHI|nr:uncharacterized protein LOC107908032 [Gossypium hirsutum]
MDIKYFVGDYVFLKVSPRKKVLRLGRKGKLSSRFVGPYRILKRVGSVTYQFELPPKLDHIHDVFHVSMLRRYRSDPSHIIFVEEIKVRPNLTFKEKPIQILDQNVKVFRRKSILFVKVLWRNHGTEEATWEPEDSIRQQYSHLLESGSKSLAGVFASELVKWFLSPRDEMAWHSPLRNDDLVEDCPTKVTVG